MQCGEKYFDRKKDFGTGCIIIYSDRLPWRERKGSVGGDPVRAQLPS